MNYPTDKHGRYMRIPTPLKRESSQHRPIFKLEWLIAMHKRSIAREKKTLGVNDYGLLWISFFRGFLIAIILERLIFQ